MNFLKNDSFWEIYFPCLQITIFKSKWTRRIFSTVLLVTTLLWNHLIRGIKYIFVFYPRTHLPTHPYFYFYFTDWTSLIWTSVKINKPGTTWCHLNWLILQIRRTLFQNPACCMTVHACCLLALWPFSINIFPLAATDKYIKPQTLLMHDVGKIHRWL